MRWPLIHRPRRIPERTAAVHSDTAAHSGGEAPDRQTCEGMISRKWRISSPEDRFVLVRRNVLGRDRPGPRRVEISVEAVMKSVTTSFAQASSSDVLSFSCAGTTTM